ncbi:hypothetical protein GCM10022248_07840 [Nonomuraea soli]
MGRTQWARSVAIGIATLAVVLELTDVWITAQLPPSPYTPLPMQPEDMAGTAFPIFGAILVHHRPRLVIGWLLSLGGLAAAVNIVSANAAWLAGSHPARWPVVALSWQLFMFLCGLLLPLLYPNGRLPSPRWRWLIIAAPVLSAVYWFGTPDWRPLLDQAHRLVLAVAFLSLVLRFRKSDEAERRQILWLLVALPFVIVPWIIGDPVWWVSTLTIPLIPAAIAVAILRYRLFGIDTLISRALIGIALAIVIVGVYFAGVAASSVLLSGVDQVAGLGAALLAGVFFQPMRKLVQRGVDRMLYGSTGDPAALAEEIKRRLQQAEPADGLLATLEVLREGLAVTGAAVRLDGGTTTSGDLTHTVREIPLTWHGEPVGTLLIGPPGKRRFPAAHDERVLATLTPYLADAAHAVRLTTALQRSRERILTAREEERRRLRRDLHDGLGQSLTGMAMSINLARMTMRDSPDTAEELLGRLRTGMAEVSDDIRTLVYGLRPPALDELGLAGAAEQLLDAAVRTEGELAGLPAAVEVAAYRILQEAITNARKHAAARTIEVCLVRERDRLRVSVSDDGCGLPLRPQAGVGLGSMRERAAELGGTCTVRPAEGGGTVVHADLPL